MLRVADGGLATHPPTGRAHAGPHLKDGPKPTLVAAHFRLDDGGQHAAECAYNADEVVRAIARASQGLAQVDDAGRLRLVLPTGPGEPAPAQPGTAEPDGGRGRSLVFTTVRPEVPPALNSTPRSPTSWPCTTSTPRS